MRYEVRRPVTYFFYWNTPIAATALKNGPSPLPEVLSTSERSLKREDAEDRRDFMINPPEN